MGAGTADVMHVLHERELDRWVAGGGGAREGGEGPGRGDEFTDCLKSCSCTEVGVNSREI